MKKILISSMIFVLIFAMSGFVLAEEVTEPEEIKQPFLEVIWDALMSLQGQINSLFGIFVKTEDTDDWDKNMYDDITECSCQITQEDYDSIIARLNALEGVCIPEEEVCDDGIDNDCDGEIDEGCVCDSCITDNDCINLPGGACTFLGEGSYCTQACEDDGTCPEGYTCEDQPGGEAQCIPITQSCSCTIETIGITQSCENINMYGICTGTQTCNEAGWTACDAIIPELETCDGLDNDCDGQIDEEEVCGECSIALDCDDGLYCNGVEVCFEGSCVSLGDSPCPGPDGDIDCSESCDESSDDCTANDPDSSFCSYSGLDDGMCTSGTCMSI
ncbi:MAG: MopE-related protein [archaeon]